MALALTWKRKAAGSYQALDSDGKVVASADLTGRYGSDNYPWDWCILLDLPTIRRENGLVVNQSGAEESFRACKDKVAQVYSLSVVVPAGAPHSAPPVAPVEKFRTQYRGAGRWVVVDAKDRVRAEATTELTADIQVSLLRDGAVGDPREFERRHEAATDAYRATLEPVSATPAKTLPGGAAGAAITAALVEFWKSKGAPEESTELLELLNSWWG